MSKVLREPAKAITLDRTTRRTTTQRIEALPFLQMSARVIILLLFALFFGVPLLWLILAPTKTNSELFSLPPLAFGSFQNIAIAWGHLLQFNSGEIITWLGNSVLYAVGAVLLTVVVTIPAGYALATMKFRGRYTLLMTTLIVMILPGAATVLPLFLEINAVHMINTAYAVILPSAFFPFGAYLTYIYFATSLPGDLLDAGRVDGCSEFMLFTRVAMPLATPIISLVSFFSFIGIWNNYFLPYVMLSDDSKYNLPVGLYALISGSPGVHPGIGTELPIFGPEEALAGVIVVLPILIMFIFSQRYVVAGIFGGSVKG
jgi:multiple sugar transport system permease protein